MADRRGRQASLAAGDHHRSRAGIVVAAIALVDVDAVRVDAATVIAELGDITRFENPRQLMAYLGLVPSEHSSDGTRRQGGIAKAGNGTAWANAGRGCLELSVRCENQP